MEGTSGRNVARLRQAGFEINPDLPEIYAQVIEDLSDAEVALLIGANALFSSVKERLDLAEESRPPDVGAHAEFVMGPQF